MPVILRVGGLNFFFYSNEGNPLKAPHIHVRGDGGEAKISLSEPNCILRNNGYSAADLRGICELVKRHQHVLVEAFHEYFA